MRYRVTLAAAVAVGAVAVNAFAPVPASAADGVTERVSIATDGSQGNDITGRFAGPAINADGRVVAFDSIAKTLVPDDENRRADVFVHDRDTGVTARVSVRSNGDEGEGTSTRPALDGAGNLVAFDSDAENLVGNDDNNRMDVFVHDRSLDATSRVSVSSDEEEADGSSNSPTISTDGRYVSFVSNAPNLVPEDGNTIEDIFVRDLVSGTTERVSVASDGEAGNSSSTLASISGDGNVVAFISFVDNLVPNDDNETFDIFVHDRTTGETELVSVDSDENQADATSSGPNLNHDGSLIAFWSDATNLIPDDGNERRDVFVRDRVAGTTERISVSSDEVESDGTSQEPGVRGFIASGPDISDDGRMVTFFASATNLVPGDTNTCPRFFDGEPGRCPDVFLRDRLRGTTVRINTAPDGTDANDRTADPTISNDGRSIAYFSAASNLVEGDTKTCPVFLGPGNCPDIFVHDAPGNNVEAADLRVGQSDSDDPVAAGAPLRYRIRVTNDGPLAATDVRLVDRLPEAVDFLSATSTAGECVNQSGRVKCDLGTIAPGATVDVQVRVQAPDEVGTIRNDVTVEARQTDPFPNNNTDTETTAVTAP